MCTNRRWEVIGTHIRANDTWTAVCARLCRGAHATVERISRHHLAHLEPDALAEPAGTVSPTTGAPGISPTTRRPEVCASASIGAESLTITGVRVQRGHGLGAAESGVAELERRLRVSPFAAPERDDLQALGLGAKELAAHRLGRLLRRTR